MKTRILLAVLCALCALGIASAQSTTSNSVAKTLGQSATVAWTAPTTYVTGAPIASGTAITYSVYEAQQAAGSSCTAPSGAPVVTGLTATSYVTPTYTAVGVYCYDVTDTVAGTESAPSNVVSAVVSAPVPNAPAATIQ